MRALLKCWEMETRQVNGDILGLSGPNSGNMGGNLNNSKNYQPPTNEFDPDVKIKLESNLDYPSLNGSHNADFSSPGFQNFTTSPANPTRLMEANNPDLVTISKNLDSGTKKFRKRKSTDSLPWKSPKGKDELEVRLENPENVIECSSKGVSDIKASSSSAPVVELSLSSIDSSASVSEKLEFGDDSFLEINEVEDVEEYLKNGAKKVKKNMVEITTTPPNDKKSPTQLLADLEHKNLVPPSVSITPISVKPNMSALPPMVLERRPGIEIFPVVSSPIPQSPVSSSITITAISAKTVSEEKLKEKKKQKLELDRAKLDKKRKRKRDDSPMGPPEKVPSKTDSKTNLSVKPSDSSSPRPSSPAGTVRKYNCSPTHSPLATGKSSPSNCSSKLSKSLSGSHSTKNISPSTSSPKNSPVSANASPKHSLLLPKTGSSGSGKPSMSTLKSAVSSPSSNSKSDPKKSSSKESRDKDRKSSNFLSSGRSSPKIKSSSVKLKQLDLPVDSTVLVTDVSLASATDPKQAAAMRNRKGSLSAVIDKLKSAQGGTGDPGGEGNDGGGGGGNKSVTPSKDSRSSSYSSKTSDKLMGNKAVDSGKNPGEYMIKPSSDGMKITINKTRMKDMKSTKTVGSAGTNSPKAHTGLKPGVVSGPASKKPQVMTKTNSSSSLSSKSPSSKPLFRSNSSGNLMKSIKSTNLSKPGSDVNRNKPKLSSKLDSGKSIFSSKTGKASPTMIKDDGETKSNKIDPSHPAPIIEGFKQLDTKFQIPKLSARANNTSTDSEAWKKSSSFSDKSYSSSTESGRAESKVIEVGAKTEPSLSKHPIVSLNLLKNVDDKLSYGDSSKRSNVAKVSESSESEAVLADSASSLSVSSTEASQNPVSTGVGLPKSKSDTNLKLSSITSNLASSKDDSLSSLKMDLPISSLSFSDNANNSFKKMPDSNVSKVSENKVSESPKVGAGSQSQEAAEILIDFSSSSFPNNNKITDTQKLTPIPERTVASLPARRNNSPSVFPHSPSVQVHIVKSPVSILPSPHSASPCITDDELMDEALVGSGK